MGGVHPDASLTTAKSTSTESMAAMNASNGNNPPDTSLPAAMVTDVGGAKESTPAAIDAAKGAKPGHSLVTDVGGAKESTPAAIDAAKAANPGHSLVTDVGGAKESTPAAIDAAKAANPGHSLVTDVGGAKESTPAAIDAAKAANPGHPLVTDVGGAKESTPAAIDAAKAANPGDPLATDVDAAKVANTDHPLATLVDAAKGANIDNIDNSTVNLLVAASPPIPDVAIVQPPKFDIIEAQSLLTKKDWQGLDDLLCKFVGDCLGKDTLDAGMMHPGLLLIPREEKIIQLLQNQAFEEAMNFSAKFIEPLKKCESKFKPLSLEQRIDDLIMILNERSAARTSGVDVGGSISDYMFLYFPRAMCDEPNHAEVGTWQFAMKLPVQSNQISSTGKSLKPRHGFRCLACGWTIQGTMSITALKNHIVHSRDGKCCPNVTQEMLDRMKLIDNSKDVPDLSTIAARFKNKKRKGASSGSTANQNTGSSPSAAGESPSSVAHTSKKLKVAPPTESHTLPSSPAAAAEVVVAGASSRGLEKIVTEKVDILRGIATFILEIEEPVDPEILRNKALELEEVAFDLKVAAVNSRRGTALLAQNIALSVSAPSSEMLSKTDKV